MNELNSKNRLSKGSLLTILIVINIIIILCISLDVMIIQNSLKLEINGIIINIIHTIIIMILSSFLIKSIYKDCHREQNTHSMLLITLIIIYIICSIFYILICLESATYSEKPIIYLYPTEETEVSVKLLKNNNITSSYPKYIDGWNVIAKPNGDLTYIENGKELYSLYYECEDKYEYKVEKDGFIVKGENSAQFLEEKLAILGLTEREAEEFIIYWLPKLESNNYNYIRFATQAEINENMPIEITPEPDTFIRIIMTYKPLTEAIEVEEQHLEKNERKGYVAVEWGGSEIK